METLRNSCFPHIQSCSLLQNKYKEEGKKEMSSSLYSQLPETAEMQLAKAVQEFQSEVRFGIFYGSTHGLFQAGLAERLQMNEMRATFHLTTCFNGSSLI